VNPLAGLRGQLASAVPAYGDETIGEGREGARRLVRREAMPPHPLCAQSSQEESDRAGCCGTPTTPRPRWRAIRPPEVTEAPEE
jgi:hypothetical protein